MTFLFLLLFGAFVACAVAVFAAAWIMAMVAVIALRLTLALAGAILAAAFSDR